jgi:hypothetical protein
VETMTTDLGPGPIVRPVAQREEDGRRAATLVRLPIANGRVGPVAVVSVGVPDLPGDKARDANARGACAPAQHGGLAWPRQVAHQRGRR